MPDYTAEISRANPTCFLILVDQSGSMNQAFGGSDRSKAREVADVINRLLQTLVYRCAMGASILDRYYIGVIGYGKTVGPALGGELAGRGVVPVSEIGNKPLRVEERLKKEPDGAGGLIEQRIKFPIWFEPVAAQRTPMCEALLQAQQTVQGFVDQFPNCFPPIVFNISDGAATDGEPEANAAKVREVCSEDGNVLLFNIHISTKAEQKIEYPSTEETLPDKNARTLFRMSSELPPLMRRQASTDVALGDNARGFVFNGDLVSVVQLLDIGTRVDPTMR